MEKRPSNQNVYYLDQKKNKSRKESNQQQDNNIIYLTTTCDICKCQTTKKNFINDSFYCEECASLSPSDMYEKVCDEMESYFKKEIQEYIDWDSEDLDSLYYAFWCDEDDIK